MILPPPSAVAAIVDNKVFNLTLTEFGENSENLGAGRGAPGRKEAPLIGSRGALQARRVSSIYAFGMLAFALIALRPTHVMSFRINAYAQ